MGMLGKLSSLVAIGLVTMNCSSEHNAGSSKPFAVQERDIAVNGRKVVTLSAAPSSDTAQPRILGADILPGRGMNIYQIRGYLPGKGAINLLASPPVEQAPQLLNFGPGDEFGNRGFKFGAILLPYANRIRGKLSPDGKTLETTILDKTVHLPANWKGKQPGSEPHAMHGMILARSMDSVDTHADDQQAVVTGTLDAGDFEGHWLSKTFVTISAALKNGTFGFQVTAKNTGTEDLPMGIGWHPYFALPSGNREQARLHIPARQRTIVNNYNDVFPTGQLTPIAGTKYDFSVRGGAPLGKLFLDDCFVDLKRNSQGQLVAEVIDPAAKYGLRFRALSPEFSAYQVFAPLDQQVVAFEPQFNWADPFSSIWKGKNTGMAVLKPGQSVTYSLELEMFVP
jgi:aldose 1-epimerase